MPAGDIDTTNIAYTELKDAYNEVSTPDPYVDPISMSKFRGVKYVTFSGTTIQEGQSIYTNTSTSANATFSWTCPSLVTSVSVVCCGVWLTLIMLSLIGFGFVVWLVLITHVLIAVYISRPSV